MIKYVIGFVVLIWAEWQVWFWASDYIGGLGVFFFTLFGFMYGTSLIRKSVAGVSASRAMQGRAVQPTAALLASSLAGVLFALPGFISDAVAVLLLLGPVQNILARRLQSGLLSRMSTMSGMGAGLGGMFGAGGGVSNAASAEELKAAFEQMFGQKRTDTNIIEGEAVEVDEQLSAPKQVTHSAKASDKFKDVNS